MQHKDVEREDLLKVRLRVPSMRGGETSEGREITFFAQQEERKEEIPLHGGGKSAIIHTEGGKRKMSPQKGSPYRLGEKQGREKNFKRNRVREGPGGKKNRKKHSQKGKGGEKNVPRNQDFLWSFLPAKGRGEIFKKGPLSPRGAPDQERFPFFPVPKRNRDAAPMEKVEDPKERGNAAEDRGRGKRGGGKIGRLPPGGKKKIESIVSGKKKNGHLPRREEKNNNPLKEEEKKRRGGKRRNGNIYIKKEGTRGEG